MRFFVIMLFIPFMNGANAQPAPRHLEMPQGLMEISGLAAAAENRVFAHNDEFGIVYEIDLANGEIVGAFALGDPTVTADFEGIEAHDGRIYLVASDGKIYEAEIGAHRERKRFNVYDTGAECEVEGLARAPAPDEFFVLCKREKRKGPPERLRIYRWSLADRLPETAPAIDVSVATFVAPSERENFRPSAIEWDAAASRLMIVSSRTAILYLFDEDGAYRDRMQLSSSRHVQTEGLALTAAGALVTADEGAGRGAGLITVYEQIP